MHRILALVSFLALSAALSAGMLPVTPFTVVAKVTSYEHYRALGSPHRYSLETPHGNSSTLIATILQPDLLAGREIAIPFESLRSGKELLVQKDTIFRFEHTRNLADLRNRTDLVRRSVVAFPERGILVLKPDGEVGEAYAGILTASK